MIDFLKKQLFTVHQNGKHQVSEVFKFIGPGIIVTVGFIDPGNWAANLAAGASYGYELLWVVTLSTIMLILLQHNVAHLGIVRGQCLSECAYEFLPRYVSRFVLSTAGIAAALTGRSSPRAWAISFPCATASCRASTATATPRLMLR